MSESSPWADTAPGDLIHFEMMPSFTTLVLTQAGWYTLRPEQGACGPKHRCLASACVLSFPSASGLQSNWSWVALHGSAGVLRSITSATFCWLQVSSKPHRFRGGHIYHLLLENIKEFVPPPLIIMTYMLGDYYSRVYDKKARLLSLPTIPVPSTPIQLLLILFLVLLVFVPLWI